MQCEEHDEVAVHAALLELPIALSHTALNTDFKILCRAAQVCRSWRDAVQQCTARNVAVELNTLSGRANLQGFSKWLCKHARLVSSITAAVGKWEPSRNAQLSELVDAEQWRNQFRAVEDLLLQALQLAANPTGTYVSTSAAAAAAAAVPEQQGLQLSSFSTGLPGEALLAALPAHSLTNLELDYADRTHAVDSAALSAALARLSSLRQLSITGASDYNKFSCSLCGSCLSGVQQLSCLTSLKLAGDWSDLGAHLETVLAPPQLQQLQHLDLMELLAPVSGGLDLSQLTQLTALSIEELVTYDGEHVELPVQLQRLQLGSSGGLESYRKVFQLTQLKHLKLMVDDEDSDLLLQLGQLPALEHLELQCYEVEPAAATAPVWPQLKQLRVLELDIDMYQCSSRQLAPMLNAAAACSGITQLVVTFTLTGGSSSSSSSEDDDDDQDQDASSDMDDGVGGVECHGGGSGSVQQLSPDVFATAAGLPGLRDLCIGIADFSGGVLPGDAMKLTALTGLTQLVLDGCNASVDDLAATALAYSCKQLRHLDLQRCELGSMACLAVVAQLQHLQELRLEGSGRVTVRGLTLLTQLQDLQQLGVDENDEVTADVIQSILSARWLTLGR